MQSKYGTDALRMGLLVNNAPGTDMNLDPDKVNAYKKFANKIWNIARFVLTEIGDTELTRPEALSEADQAILTNLNTITATVTTMMETSKLYLASEEIYHFVWHELADKILEESKPILGGDDAQAKYARQYVLRECLVTSLKLLHPFMPFVTETIWQHLPKIYSRMNVHSSWSQRGQSILHRAC